MLSLLHYCIDALWAAVSCGIECCAVKGLQDGFLVHHNVFIEIGVLGRDLFERLQNGFSPIDVGTVIWI